MLTYIHNRYMNNHLNGRSVLEESLSTVHSGKYFPATVRISAYLFFAALPWDAIAVAKNFSITNLAGVLFAATYIFSIKPSFRNIPSGLKYLIIYFAYAIIHSLIIAVWSNEGLASIIRSSAITNIQLAIMIMIIYDITKKREVLVGCTGIYVFSYFISSMMVYIDFMELQYLWNKSGRLTMNYQDLNTVARELAIMIVLIVCILTIKSYRTTYVRLVLFVITFVFIVNIINTGSRGGLITLMFGLLIATILHLKFSRMYLYFAALTIIIFFLYETILSNMVMMERLEKTIYVRDTGGRFELFARGWQMFLEKPIMGWGPDRYYYYTGFRPNALGMAVIHNAYLQILLGVGLVGFLFFVVGMYKIIKITIKKSNNLYGSIPLIILLTNLLGALPLDLARNKMFWIINILALNASYIKKKNSNKYPNK